MALIKINIADSLLSESAAKKPGYKMAKVGGATALVISSEHKPAVSKCISNARKAQKLALSALKNRIEANTIAAVRVPREENPARKTKLRQRVKAMKSKASADVKTAKQLLREGTAAMKAAGLSALSSPLKVSDISLTSEPGRSARTVKAAQTDSLVVKGQKGYIKPKFLAASKFEALGSKTTTKAAKTEKAPAKKTKGTTGGTQYKTIGQKNDAARQHLQDQSKQWDKDTRMVKRMMKELNGGKSITAKAGWSGSVKNGKGVFTNKSGKKITVKKSDMAKYGLTPASFQRALGEADIHDTDKH